MISVTGEQLQKASGYVRSEARRAPVDLDPLVAEQPQPRIEFGVNSQGEDKIYFVKDNGAGFDMQHAADLFTIFRRMHSNDEFQGHGIGLSIVHRIIERHGGRIWAEAAPGAGATFFFTLGEPQL